MEFFSLKEKKSIDFRYYVWNSAMYFAEKKKRLSCVHVCTHISTRINPYNTISEPALPIARAGFSNT